MVRVTSIHNDQVTPMCEVSNRLRQGLRGVPTGEVEPAWECSIDVGGHWSGAAVRAQVKRVEFCGWRGGGQPLEGAVTRIEARLTDRVHPGLLGNVVVELVLTVSPLFTSVALYYTYILDMGEKLTLHSEVLLRI